MNLTANGESSTRTGQNISFLKTTDTYTDKRKAIDENTRLDLAV